MVRGLRRRLSAVFGLVIATLVVCVIAVNTVVQVKFVKERLDTRAGHLLELAEEVSLRFLIENRPAELEILFEDLGDQPDVVQIYLIDSAGTVFVHSELSVLDYFLMPSDDPLAAQSRRQGRTIMARSGDLRHYARPINIGGVHYGVLRIDISEATASREVMTVLSRNTLIGALFVLLGIAISGIISQRLTQPLQLLTEATKKAAGGDLRQSIDLRTNDEFESLGRSFNRMLGALRASMMKVNVTAYRDTLTGIPNRAWLMDTLQAVVKDARDTGQELAVLFLDMDGFKKVNDLHGHQAGDTLLFEFTRRLSASLGEIGLREYDLEATFVRPLNPAAGEAAIARLGGDEFTVIVRIGDAVSLAETIVAAMQPTFRIDNKVCAVSASIGIATYPRHAATMKDLIKCADTAMYQAKDAGRNCWRFYDLEHHLLSVERAKLESEIKFAIADNQFVAYLQPQFEVATGALTGAEALVRWHHPERGILLPNDFLPIAKEMGLLPDIGKCVVEQSLAAAAFAQTTPGFVLAINVSVVELLDNSFIDHLLATYDRFEFSQGAVEIEITEETLMDIDLNVEERIARLKAVGLRLAIDDFGVGYSNLGRLRHLAFDTLKVDRSLTVGVGEQADANALMLAILDMARAIEIDVIAEGIETETQLAFLSANGCRFYQGFWGGKPVPCDVFRSDYLRDQDRRRSSRMA